jgi:hypothetical protein
MKDQDMDPKESGAQNPYRLLMHKLTGTSTQKPRLKTATNVWRKTQRSEIDAEVKKITEHTQLARSALAATRDKVAREMFDKLPEAEKAQWFEQAKEEHEAALARWKEDNEGNFSEAPADRQRYAFSSSFPNLLALTNPQVYPRISSLRPTNPGFDCWCHGVELLLDCRWA